MIVTSPAYIAEQDRLNKEARAMQDWPPRFTFTPEGVAGLFLRKHFAAYATAEHQRELADLIRDCVASHDTPTAARLRDQGVNPDTFLPKR